MRKITLIACALFLTLTEMNAQIFIGDDTEGISPTDPTPKAKTDTPAPTGEETTDSKKKYESIFDFTVGINTDTDQYSFKMGDDHYHYGMAFGDDLFSMSFGYGFGHSYIFEDAFLIKGRLYPYLGFSSYGDNTLFLYGAAANIDIGLRLWKTENGNSGFITAGYNISAPEFNTTGMFEYGSWGFGISIVYW